MGFTRGDSKLCVIVLLIIFHPQKAGYRQFKNNLQTFIFHKILLYADHLGRCCGVLIRNHSPQNMLNFPKLSSLAHLDNSKTASFKDFKTNKKEDNLRKDA